MAKQIKMVSVKMCIVKKADTLKDLFVNTLHTKSVMKMKELN